MIFNDPVFFIAFLVPSVATFHLVRPAVKPWVIAGFGVAFFLYFSWVMFGSGWASLTVLILLWECVTSRFYKKGSRFCLLGIWQAVVLLCIFKYLGFLARIWNDSTGWLSFPPLHGVPKLILPLGLSFFTFEFIHYAADCYVGKIERSRVREYAAFIFFFPTMVAGPIKRFQQFTTELAHARFDPAFVSQGITRIAVGLGKKHVLADTFDMWSTPLNTDALYGSSRWVIVGRVVAYTWKMYFDFSGYSDIAIGSARLFGIGVPENFNFPYFARNIGDFWRRWHISLMSWLESYVFVPLLFSRFRLPGFEGRANPRRLALATVAVFVASGIWHGASYNFVIWGFYQGFLVAGYRYVKSLPRFESRELPRPLGIALTYLSVAFGDILFAMDERHARFALARLFGIG
ncbi:MAG TPA: MBOAT family O-acyltransferase [Polyangiaceae bacterium]|nr:MBOAT family O-acyltransferase [Polyangiaceae bacterium]